MHRAKTSNPRLLRGNEAEQDYYEGGGDARIRIMRVIMLHVDPRVDWSTSSMAHRYHGCLAFNHCLSTMEAVYVAIIETEKVGLCLGV